LKLNSKQVGLKVVITKGMLDSYSSQLSFFFKIDILNALSQF